MVNGDFVLIRVAIVIVVGVRVLTDAVLIGVEGLGWAMRVWKRRGSTSM